MSAVRGRILAMSVAAALVVAPAPMSTSEGANAPPVPAPRTPVTVQPLPPVHESAPAAAPLPPSTAATAAPAPPEKALWQRPELYAWIALLETFGASAATIAYLRKPERARLRIAAVLTASSAVFVAAALAAWLL